LAEKNTHTKSRLLIQEIKNKTNHKTHDGVRHESIVVVKMR